MPLSAEQTVELRSHIGTADPPAQADLDARYERLGSIAAVAVEVLRERLANFLAQPAEFDVDGDYSQDVSANIKALQAKLGELTPLIPSAAPAALSTGRLVRANRLR